MSKETLERQTKPDAKNRLVGIFPFEFDENLQLDDKTKIPDSIHLIPIGEWEHDAYGPIKITPSDIREFQANFNAGVRKGVFITAGHEGFEELPAVGWITEVEARDNGLWGMVDWNDEGKKLLSDKAFKFFSPEFYRDYEDPQTHQQYRNVLTGGALTKSPYFKELEAVVFSTKALLKKFNQTQTMNLQELVSKNVADLTPEEITFIKENAAELTDEQKTALTSVLDAPAETAEEKAAREAKEAETAKAEADAAAAKEAEDKAAADKVAADAAAAAGGEGAGTGDQVQASEIVKITAGELAALKTAAAQGKEAFAEIAKAKTDATVKALIFSDSNKSGKFLPKSEKSLQSFIETLNESQRQSFSTLLGELPKSEAFREIGSGVGAAEGSAQAEIDAKIKVKMTEKSGLKYGDAMKEVFAETPELAKRYNEEVSAK